MKNRYIEVKITKKDLLLGIGILFSNVLCFFCSYVIYERYWQTNEVISGISAEKYKYTYTNDIHNIKSTLGKDNLQWTTECNAMFHSDDTLLSLDITSGWFIDGHSFPFMIQFSKDNIEDEFFLTLVTCDISGNAACEYYDINQDGEFDAFKEVVDGSEYINIEGSFLKVERIEINNELSIADMNGTSYSFINGIWQTGVI